MPKITDEPLTVIQLRLFTSDLNALRRSVGTTLGVNKAIRTMVRAYVRRMEARANAQIDAAEAHEGAEL